MKLYLLTLYSGLDSLELGELWLDGDKNPLEYIPAPEKWNHNYRFVIEELGGELVEVSGYPTEEESQMITECITAGDVAFVLRKNINLID